MKIHNASDCVTHRYIFTVAHNSWFKIPLTDLSDDAETSLVQKCRTP